MNVVVVAAMVLAGVAVLYVVVGVAHDVVATHLARRRDKAVALVAAVLLGTEAEAADAVVALERFRRRLLLGVVHELSLDIDGMGRGRLRALAQATGIATHLRRRVWLRRSWRHRAQHAQYTHLLPLDDPVRRRLLDDRHPLVRSRALEGLTRDEVVALAPEVIDRLHDPAAVVRFAAQQALLSADSRVAMSLETALRHETVTTDLLEVAVHFGDPRLVDGIVLQATASDPARRAFAADGLGAATNAGHLAVLEQLLADADPHVRAAAARAAGRSGRAVLAPRLGPMLGDPHWAVRQAAGHALGRLDAVGELVLRSGRFADDRYARDMSRQVLDRLAAERGDRRVLSADELRAVDEVGAA